MTDFGSKAHEGEQHPVVAQEQSLVVPVSTSGLGSIIREVMERHGIKPLPEDRVTGAEEQGMDLDELNGFNHDLDGENAESSTDDEPLLIVETRPEAIPVDSRPLRRSKLNRR